MSDLVACPRCVKAKSELHHARLIKKCWLCDGQLIPQALAVEYALRHGHQHRRQVTFYEIAQLREAHQLKKVDPTNIAVVLGESQILAEERRRLGI